MAAPLTPSSGDPSPAQQASRGATPAPRPLPVSRLPRTSDPAVRARREDAVVKAFEDFEAVTVGAEWLPTQDTLEIAA